MKKLLGIMSVVGALLLSTSVFAQEDVCFTKEGIVEAFSNMQPKVAFEDEDTLVLKSDFVSTYLVVEFKDNCAVSQVEIDQVKFDLAYGEGV